ncbi:1-phosphofructokinase family hexose kinase [Nibrella saemangeumensis]|uniref:1-phosphofructokinase family hexose kinase n=1 Tax=Nibrella saemangeumensis TaxID=1084526 RepID=A0ABP8MIN3_9BACT
MIVTLTLNPTVDTSTTIDRIAADHKLRCASPRYDAGGGGINVSKAIRRLDGESLALFTSGGAMGLMLQELVEKEGIEHQIIGIEGLTRENFIITETSTNHQFRFGMPGPTLTHAEAEACLAALENLPAKPDYIVASGSLPPGISEDFYAIVARQAKKLNARFILDTSGEPLRAAANEGVFLLKPNLGELSRMAGVETLEMSDVDDAAMEIINRGDCEVVVVSLGPGGAMLVTRDSYEHVHTPTVRKQSTVGAGDSMVGGMVYALSQGQSFSEMVRLGVACGTAATMNPGTELFKKPDVDRLLNWINNH